MVKAATTHQTQGAVGQAITLTNSPLEHKRSKPPTTYCSTSSERPYHGLLVQLAFGELTDGNNTSPQQEHS